MSRRSLPPDSASCTPRARPDTSRLRVQVGGAVQGVGFRPFVYRLAHEMGLGGWVENSPEGVRLEVEGETAKLENFVRRLQHEKPPSAVISHLESLPVDPLGEAVFKIGSSTRRGKRRAVIVPDLATCPVCLRELFDPSDRRYRYPFINCENCGPRFTIIEALPYDRANTSMKRFSMCPACSTEYNDPSNRRFHAQPNACPECGPHLELWEGSGKRIASKENALLNAADALRRGRIVALKGLGGFQLLTQAANDASLRRLRDGKGRDEKPFALMYPTMDLLRRDCNPSDQEERLLLSPASPIVLLKEKGTGRGSTLSPGVAPGSADLGVMLPYTPLHHLLMREFGAPLVATSGNRSQEPICTDEVEAIERLGGIADLFLVHNRPIARASDDSVVQILLEKPSMIRRARGYAALPVCLGEKVPLTLAVGGHLKNTVALAIEESVVMSPHVGDLQTQRGLEAFEASIEHLKRAYRVDPSRIACDLHPDYGSSAWARRSGAALIRVQHHHAHVASCMAEHGIFGTVLGVAWDGSGYGTDGTLWGGEFLRTTRGTFNRLGFFRRFRLPGAERAVREPRRAALGLLYEIFGERAFDRHGLLPLGAFSRAELRVIRGMLAAGVQSPVTSSVGRLFDAVASLIGLRQQDGFEGQAAMAVEFALRAETSSECYPLDIEPSSPGPLPFVVDWEPMILRILEDLRAGVSAGKISLLFHNSLVEAIVAAAVRAGEKRVVLSGGCFQNRYLTERAVVRLRAEGFSPYWHQLVPPNDGGLSLGQAVVASHRIKEERDCA